MTLVMTPKSKKSSGGKKQASIFSFFSKTPSKPVIKEEESNEPFVKHEEPSLLGTPPGTSAKSAKESSSQRDANVTMDTTLSSPLKNKGSTPDQDDNIQLSTPLNSSQDDGILVGTKRGKVNYSELSDSDNEDMPVKVKKRKQRRVHDSDLEDEFVPEQVSESDDDVAGPLDDDLELHGSLNDVSMSEEDELNQLLDQDEKKTQQKSVPSKKLSEKFGAKSNYVAKPTVKKPATSKDSLGKSFKKMNEERYHWLVEVKDSEKRLESDPNYDPRTLYIPLSAWANFTAFEKQYWDIKGKMWDCIVFFKKGKFYELYEKDAHLAHSLFDLKLANAGRANMQLAGVPEMSFDYWAAEFISKGYKVAKVDQTETALGKELNDRASGKKVAKVIQRELSCVLTGGTLTDSGLLKNEMATYCMAIKQELNRDGTNRFGLSIIDASTGALRVTEFDDDAECSNLETFVNQVKPKEVIVEKNNLSSLAAKIIKFNAAENFLWNVLKPEVEFWDYDTTLEEFSKGKYFPGKDLDDKSSWPKILVDYSEHKPVSFSSFGGLLFYLRSLKLDHSLISLGNVDEYDIYKSSSSLILDGQTLQNLEIFNNAFDGSDKGTLFKLINRAITPFGKRTLKSWVCHPLLEAKKINERLDAVEGLLNDVNLLELLCHSLRKLPDLERMIARIHSGNLNIKEFAKVINGFDTIKKLVKSVINEYGSVDNLPGVLSSYFQAIPTGLAEAVECWDTSFDQLKALEEDVLIPEKGFDQEFDDSLELQHLLEKKLIDHLRQYKREYKSQEICFRDSGKELYLIEVPIKVIKRIPKNWVMMASTAKVKRYWSPEVKDLVQQLMEAKELHKVIDESLKSRFYAKFDASYTMWLNTVKLVSNIDCIISLTSTSENIGSPSCRPQFMESLEGQVDFTELRHPCFIGGGASGVLEFIPNDIRLGGKHSNLGLLTGANAAGKSTVLRMTCVAVILAQLGCFVPAESAKLTPIDRIMTRLGANDNIMQGKSTFFVELSETKRMLESATPRSLLLLDELGRGGSSSDGFAIAEAVLHHIATHIQSIGFFATHYANLGMSFKHHTSVAPMRMSILVDEGSRNVTFLYKLESGAAAGSFGMNVASMCGINSKIIDEAEVAANDLEHTSRIKKSNELAKLSEAGIPLGLQSDISWLINGGLSNGAGAIGEGCRVYDDNVKTNLMRNILSIVEGL